MEPEKGGAQMPIVLRVSPERQAATLLISVFLGLVLLLMGLAAGLWPMGAAGAVVLVTGVLWNRYRRGCEIVFEADRVTVRTPFSRESCRYEGLNFLLRRSWTVTFRRGGTSASGLAGTAIQLRRGSKPVVTVSASLWNGKQLRRAIAFLEGLPNPKRYL